jgi:hypothetical protein
VRLLPMRRHLHLRRPIKPCITTITIGTTITIIGTITIITIWIKLRQHLQLHLNKLLVGVKSRRLIKRLRA